MVTTLKSEWSLSSWNLLHFAVKVSKFSYFFVLSLNVMTSMSKLKIDFIVAKDFTTLLKVKIGQNI